MGRGNGPSSGKGTEGLPPHRVSGAGLSAPFLAGLPWDLQAPCLVCCGFRPPRPASLSLRLDTAGHLDTVGNQAAGGVRGPG